MEVDPTVALWMEQEGYLLSSSSSLMLVVGYGYHGLNDNMDPMVVVVVVVEVGKNIAVGFAVVVVDEIIVEKIETVGVVVQIEDIDEVGRNYTAVKILALVIFVMFDHIVLL